MRYNLSLYKEVLDGPSFNIINNEYSIGWL